MKTVSELVDDCLAVLRDIPVLDVPLADSVGSVLATDVVSPTSVPARDVAARDGYAVRSSDVAGASIDHPISLPVTGEILAGQDSIDVLPPRTAIRLSSGAPIPREADALVPIEWTDAGRATVTVRRPAEEGENIRFEAEDLEAGLVALERGTRIGPRQISLLAAAGLGTVAVKPSPRVVIMSIGDELVEPGKAGHPGTVYDANSHGLATAIQELGAIVFRVPGVSDDKKALRDALQDHIVRADVIITTGGLSYGGGDNLKEVLYDLGNVRFDRVAMAPERQYGVGLIGLEGEPDSVPIYCLPGSPVAALIGYELFVRPALRRAVGHTNVYRRTVKAQAVRAWSSPSGLEEYVPVKVAGRPSEGYRFEPTGLPGQELLYGLVRANALAAIPASVDSVAVGDTLTCLVLD
ncbi:molybdopterin molybdotransferase MoeA [Flaviflexus equikiangi]|uniref:Molybdopterin molybdenumtransferase n=1 Tax=Flaviflexus equikiangi TaxID=2758573 RepID=A0ABS2TCV7_9ACTO|nr:gephyrin-like molybdotransferase Glp [Flaviflexus equikiangi]MBM9432484.1 molybdopterin molybdotransferase MoeA [Flaviflexus equikiangi]